MKVHTMRMAMVAMAMLSLFAGCAQVAYNTLQQNQALECQKLQGATDRDECLKRSSMSYDEYQRLLKKQERDN